MHSKSDRYIFKSVLSISMPAVVYKLWEETNSHAPHVCAMLLIAIKN